MSDMRCGNVRKGNGSSWSVFDILQQSKIPVICCNDLDDTETGSDAAAKKSHLRSECNPWQVVRYTKRNFHDSVHTLLGHCNTYKESKKKGIVCLDRAKILTLSALPALPVIARRQTLSVLQVEHS